MTELMRGVECASLRRPQRYEGWKLQSCYGTRGRAQAALTRALRDFQLAVVTPAIRGGSGPCVCCILPALIRHGPPPLRALLDRELAK